MKPWRRQVAAAYRDHCFGDMLDGPVIVTVDFYLPRPKSHYGTGRNAGALKPSAPAEHLTMPDLDKLTRAVGDALTRLAWRGRSCGTLRGEAPQGVPWAVSCAVELAVARRAARLAVRQVHAVGHDESVRHARQLVGVEAVV